MILTLVKVYSHMPRLGQGEHADEVGIVIVELLAHRGQFVFGEQPMAPLRRLPVVGRHLLWEKTAEAPEVSVGDAHVS